MHGLRFRIFGKTKRRKPLIIKWRASASSLARALTQIAPRAFACGKETQSATLKKVTLAGSILLGFQRFLSSDIFDYFAVMSDFGEILETRLVASSQRGVHSREARMPLVRGAMIEKRLLLGTRSSLFYMLLGNIDRKKIVSVKEMALEGKGHGIHRAEMR